MGVVRRLVVHAASRLDPHIVVAAASAIGRTVHRVHRWPRPEDVYRLFRGFPSMAADRPGFVAREIRAAHFRNRAVSALVGQRGLAPALELLAADGLTGLKDLRRRAYPTVFVTLHLGPSCGVSAALEKSGIVSLGITRRPRSVTTTERQLISVGSGEAARTAALWHAVQHLRAGGNVVIAADGALGERAREVGILGRAIRFARGPFALGRLSGASLVPIVSTWTPENTIGVEVGAPLGTHVKSGDPVEIDHEAARAMAAWAEERLLASPQDLRLRTFRRLVNAPDVGLASPGRRVEVRREQ